VDRRRKNVEGDGDGGFFLREQTSISLLRRELVGWCCAVNEGGIYGVINT
jgi:hypothetical protein